MTAGVEAYQMQARLSNEAQKVNIHLVYCPREHLGNLWKHRTELFVQIIALKYITLEKWKEKANFLPNRLQKKNHTRIRAFGHNNSTLMITNKTFL